MKLKGSFLPLVRGNPPFHSGFNFISTSLYRRRHVSLKAAKSHYCIAVAVVSLLLSYLKFQFPLNGTSSRLHFSNGSIEFRTSVWKLKAMHLNLVIRWSKGTLSQLNNMNLSLYLRRKELAQLGNRSREYRLRQQPEEEGEGMEGAELLYRPWKWS